MGDILVLAEHRQGTLRDVSFEMMALAPKLAEQMGAGVTVLLIGSGTEEMAKKMAAYGSKVLVIDDPLFENFNAEKYQKVLSLLIDELKPVLLMTGHTSQGVDFMPALAVEKSLPYVAEAIDLEYQDSVLKATRQLYSGKVNAVLSLKPADTYLVTLREGVVEPPEEAGEESIEKLDSPLKEDTPYRSFVEYIEAEVGDVDITQSDVLVAIGRGLKEDKNLPMVEELAGVLKADLAGSRAATDAGWIPHDRQVGTSGKSVKSKLYIAMGISGAFQHVAGMKGAKTVVAINKDPEAPIFAVADYAIVDDMFKIVPRLTEKLKELKG